MGEWDGIVYNFSKWIFLNISLLIGSIFSIILSDAMVVRRDVTLFFSRIGMFVLFYCTILVYNGLYITYIDNGIGLFGGLFYISSITQYFQILIFVLSLIILNMTSFYPRKFMAGDYFAYLFHYFKKDLVLKKLSVSNIISKNGEQFSILEYTIIYLFTITGSVLLISSCDLVSIYIAIELQSYGLYLLSTIYRNSEASTSAGLTYFLMGALASCFILLGIGLTYANLGVTYLDNLFVIKDLLAICDPYEITPSISYCLLLIGIGFLFKIAAAPFHYWSPDVYDGVPTVVTTFISTVGKIAILIFLLQLAHFTSNVFISSNYPWTFSILLCSLLSLIIGSFLGIAQIRIKRLFAYSTISHLGFILLALSINSVESIQSFIFYVIQYNVSNVNGLIILTAIGYSFYAFNAKTDPNYSPLEKNNSPVQLISQLKGFFQINSVLAVSFGITLFSLAGIPPLMGFFAKQLVFSAALQEGFYFLTIVGVCTSVISAAYYLFIVRTLFFDWHSYKHLNFLNNLKIPSILDHKKVYVNSDYTLSSGLSLSISILTLILLLFLFMANEWLYLANIISVFLFVPNVLL